MMAFIREPSSVMVVKDDADAAEMTTTSIAITQPALYSLRCANNIATAPTVRPIKV